MVTEKADSLAWLLKQMEAADKDLSREPIHEVLNVILTWERVP